jgi:hypothetical protein
VHQLQAFLQRCANVIGEFHGRGAGAAFLAIDHNEIRRNAGLEHGLGNREELPGVTDAELETNWLAA